MIGSRIKMHQNDSEWIEHRVKQSRSTSLIAVRCPHPPSGNPWTRTPGRTWRPWRENYSRTDSITGVIPLYVNEEFKLEDFKRNDCFSSNSKSSKFFFSRNLSSLIELIDSEELCGLKIIRQNLVGFWSVINWAHENGLILHEIGTMVVLWR